MAPATRGSGIDGLSAVSLRPSAADPASSKDASGSPSAAAYNPLKQQKVQPIDALSAQEASFWDQQIAQGNLSMCSVKYPTHVNVMLYGESGLGKTVSMMPICSRDQLGHSKLSPWEDYHSSNNVQTLTLAGLACCTMR